MDSSTIKDTHWLNIAETTAVVGSIVGSITGVFLNQFIWATIPLSASATFGLLNHQRLKKIVESQVLKEQTVLLSLVKENQDKLTTLTEIYQNKHQKSKLEIAELSDELGQVRNLATTELAMLRKEEKSDFSSTTKEIARMQNSLDRLDSLSNKVTEELQRLENKEKETRKLVRELRAIDIFSQNIKAKLNTVQSYFERGLAYQRLGNKNRAIEDYSKTIELSNNHAKAYHNRGLIYQELNISQKAIIDLRKASKLYFERGDLDKYRETRDLSQEIHQQEIEDRADEGQETSNNQQNEKVAVSNLFD